MINHALDCKAAIGKKKHILLAKASHIATSNLEEELNRYMNSFNEHHKVV